MRLDTSCLLALCVGVPVMRMEAQCTGWLLVASSVPAPIAVSPADCSGRGSGTGLFTYRLPQTVSLSAPPSVVYNGTTYTFQQWSIGAPGQTSVSTALGTTATSAIASYAAPPKCELLDVQSKDPSGGVPVPVLPNDKAGRLGGITPFTLTYASGTNVTMTFPGSHRGAPLQDIRVNGVSRGPLTMLVLAISQLIQITVEYGPVTGSLSSFGTGCKGSNGQTLTQQASGTPQVGGTVTYALAAGPPLAKAAFALGASRTRLGSLTLPFDAAPWGAPGCFILCDHLVVEYSGTDIAGTLAVVVPWPNNRSLVGLQVYSQYFALDAGANPLGVTSSNAFDTVLGGLLP